MEDKVIDAVTRINKMEDLLNDADLQVGTFEAMLNRFEKIQPNISELSQYYGSEEWYQDLAAYDTGKLPEGIACGVLSEDAVYDLLAKRRELAIKMLKLATRILENP